MQHKKLLALLSISSVFINVNAEDCYIIKQSEKILEQNGDCTKKYSPWSTFKVALSIMSYEEKILTDEKTPEWDYKKELNVSAPWNQPHNPTTWIKHNCIWYSREITKRLGLNKFKYYANLFNYGNKNISGDKGKNNQLTHSWIGSSLKISVIEEIAFIKKLSEFKLPVSKRAQEMTRNIIFYGTIDKGWKLFGKTGNCRREGWFVGWLEKGNKKIVFAKHVDAKNNKKYDLSLGKVAKKQILDIIISKYLTD